MNNHGKRDIVEIRDEYMDVFVLAFCHSLGSIIVALLAWYEVNFRRPWVKKIVDALANYLMDMTSAAYLIWMMKVRFTEEGRFAA